MSTPPASYLLDNYGGFAVGDSVVATAPFISAIQCNGPIPLPYLPDNTIQSSNDFDFGCGALYIEPSYGCAWIISPRYGEIRIPSTWGFATGDTLYLVGDIRLDIVISIPECTGDMWLIRNTLVPCEPQPTTPRTWGSIKGDFR